MKLYLIVCYVFSLLFVFVFLAEYDTNNHLKMILQYSEASGHHPASQITSSSGQRQRVH